MIEQVRTNINVRCSRCCNGCYVELAVVVRTRDVQRIGGANALTRQVNVAASVDFVIRGRIGNGDVSGSRFDRQSTAAWSQNVVDVAKADVASFSLQCECSVVGRSIQSSGDRDPRAVANLEVAVIDCRSINRQRVGRQTIEDGTASIGVSNC